MTLLLSTFTFAMIQHHRKSGGGQGTTIMQDMSILLNPFQVFDITHTGPHLA